MQDAPGSYFIIPFLRPSEGAEGAILVEVPAGGGEVDVTCELFRPNGQRVSGVTERVSGRALFATDLYSMEAGAAHVYAEGGVIHAGLLEGVKETGYADVDTLAGVAFSVDETDPAARYAMLANATQKEIFVFVNDRQGPFIPSGGAAKIEIPEPGRALRITVDQGDAVLAYLGAPVAPAK